MHESEFLGLHAQKAMEYFLAALYLVLFIPLWRYVTSDAAAPALARVLDWFRLPEGVALFQGHTWAKPEPAGMLAVGLDDLGHRLVGSPSEVLTPAVGTFLRKGERAFSLFVDGRKIDLLSPVDGEVTAVNARTRTAPGELGSDPYGTGWFVKVRPRTLSDSMRDLLCGDAATRFLEAAASSLAPEQQPAYAVGTLAQDGGAPIPGFVKELDPEHWDDVARTFFLTR